MTIETLRAESKKVVRKAIAKLRITWTDPLIDLSIQTIPSEENYISWDEQVADLVTTVPVKWAHTNDTDVTLDGTWYPMPSTLLEARKSQVGWWSENECDSNGEFTTNPTLQLTFVNRVVYGVTVAGDSALDEYPVDFTVTVQNKVGLTYITTEVLTVTGNDQVVYIGAFQNPHYNARRMVLEVSKWSTPNKLVKITEFYSAITEDFDMDEIMYINLLEEIESSDGTLPVGNISCNELDIKLQNITDRFFVGNTNSNIRNFIKRNRKIQPFFGFEYSDGSKEYVQKGLFWSGDWAVSDLDTGAQTTARDRMELLRKENFPAADVFPSVLYDQSIKTLLELVLDSAQDYMYDFSYDTSDLTDDYIVPVVLPEFFEKKTYFDVIKDLVAAGLAYAYMDIPTEDEEDENGLHCKDMLRVKRFETVFPTEHTTEDIIPITKSDFIEKNQPAKTEELANIIVVPYKVFTLVDDDWEDETFDAEVQDDDSIVEYGHLTYEYAENDFVQTEEHAEDIGDILLESYKVARKDIDVQAFGDITMTLTNKIEVPEYQKNGIDNRGTFVITKLNTEFNGTLRQTISGRKVSDQAIEPEYEIYQDTDDSETAWQDTDDAENLYQDGGA